MDSKLKKCLKSYLTGKKYYNSDIDKSYKYFKQCSILLNQLKINNQIKNDIIDIINDTEADCNKYISDVICVSIENPLNINKLNLDNDDILFNVIEIGNINYLDNYKYGQINFKIYNEFGLTPLHYAIKYGDTTFLKKSFKIGALIDETNKFGNTLLEYACLERDPNMINFLLQYGANMQKHLLFRESKKYFNNGNQIDVILLQKIIMNIDIKDISSDISIVSYLDWIFNYINKNEKIDIEYADINNITNTYKEILFDEFINKLNILINSLNSEYRDTYISIIKEELIYNLSNKLDCPNNKIEILLYYLIPFIDYKYTFQLNWVISYEIKFLIYKILKNENKINLKELKKRILLVLYDSYIKNNIISEGLIQIILLQWISKINV